MLESSLCCAARSWLDDVDPLSWVCSTRMHIAEIRTDQRTAWREAKDVASKSGGPPHFHSPIPQRCRRRSNGGQRKLHVNTEGIQKGLAVTRL